VTIQSKKCFKCEAIKPLEDFYKHPMMADGHVNKCKECNKKDVSKNYFKNHKYYRDYDNARSNSPKRVAARLEYQKTEAGKISANKAKNKYIKKNLIKYLAHNLVHSHVRDKKIEKLPCEVCGSTYRIHGHHDDYSKPLDVRWLCAAHHSQWHKKHGEGLNAN